MEKDSFFFRHRLQHLLFWLIIFLTWYFFRYQDFASRATALQVTFIKLADLALMVYVTNGILIPRLLYRKKYTSFTTVFLLLIIAGSFLKMKILGIVTNSPAFLDITENIKARIYDNVIPHFFLVVAGAAVKLMRDYRAMQQKMVEVIKEKSAAELSFLRSQINPHFLFNTLNSVYFLIDKQNSGARNALHKFSGMLRYQLYEMNSDTVSLEKEITYLRDYVDLQNLRRDEQGVVDYHLPAVAENIYIQPLLMIPFVENAFKHVSHHSANVNFIKINLEVAGGNLCFFVSNSKDDEHVITEPYGGIGLKNVARRLELLYPENHSLQIKNEQGVFSVELKIVL